MQQLLIALVDLFQPHRMDESLQSKIQHLNPLSKNPEWYDTLGFLHNETL